VKLCFSLKFTFFPKLRTRDALACLEPDEGRGQEILGSGPQASPSASENFEFERDVNRLNTRQRRQFSRKQDLAKISWFANGFARNTESWISLLLVSGHASLSE
jgi:hypothetical protein